MLVFRTHVPEVFVPLHIRLSAEHPLAQSVTASLAFNRMKPFHRPSLRPDNAGRVARYCMHCMTFSPTKQMHNQHGQQLMQPPPHLHAQYQTPQRHIITTQHEARPALQNGYMTPQQEQVQGRPSNVYSIPQLEMQAPPRTDPPKEAQKPFSKSRRWRNSANLWGD